MCWVGGAWDGVEVGAICVDQWVFDGYQGFCGGSSIRYIHVGSGRGNVSRILIQR